MLIVLKVVRCAGRCSWMSHQTSIVVYIEFAWNYTGFNSNYYYFMRILQLWKSPNYANKFQNYSSVCDSWIPVWTRPHCGSITHFIQIHFSLLISILNIYIQNLNNYMTTSIIFWRNNAITGNQKKLCNWRDQMHHFFIILQVTMSIAIVYRPQ